LTTGLTTEGQFWGRVFAANRCRISVQQLRLPQYEEKVSNIAFPVLTGEVAFMLWLVIKGAKPQPLDAATSLSTAC